MSCVINHFIFKFCKVNAATYAGDKGWISRTLLYCLPFSQDCMKDAVCFAFDNFTMNINICWYQIHTAGWKVNFLIGIIE